MTALHIAFEKTIEELWLDSEIVEDNHGDVTPATVAEEAELQLEEFIGHRHFFDRYTSNLEEILENADENYAQAFDPDQTTLADTEGL